MKRVFISLLLLLVLESQGGSCCRFSAVFEQTIFAFTQAETNPEVDKASNTAANPTHACCPLKSKAITTDDVPLNWPVTQSATRQNSKLFGCENESGFQTNGCCLTASATALNSSGAISETVAPIGITHTLFTTLPEILSIKLDPVKPTPAISSHLPIWLQTLQILC